VYQSSTEGATGGGQGESYRCRAVPVRYSGTMSSRTKEENVACPCCGYPTLQESGGYEICCLCNWEDDGQDDADADDVKGGPNGSYSLSEARENFRRYWVMYGPDRDTRVCPGDSEAALTAKKTMVHAFESMKGADERELGRLWEVVRQNSAVLEREVEESVRAYEAATGRP
jgi:Cysteine-rich CPCC